MYPVFLRDCVVCTELLDAPGSEVAFQLLLEYHHWNPGTDSLPYGLSGNVSDFPQFRSHFGAAIPCSDSYGSGRNYPDVTWREQLSFLCHPFFVICSNGHLWFSRSVLVAAQRIFNRIW